MRETGRDWLRGYATRWAIAPSEEAYASLAALLDTVRQETLKDVAEGLGKVRLQLVEGRVAVEFADR